ncbi:cytochrome P450 [Sodiomyces alkalinus F11]|uniref:Cytochrome P450 n=1 Tax=Sodiomyces alkalinus (strain CBS 110278 / VKM F-3762 / F11) TaxID=1314773 RepID=A0A3N2PR07_SODAK|nr:cytochrome P450 [Sodiomyces alkalinus F11]ROT36942.1 cytochrome P450 [Sodiomyces alkalinus F11]
MGLPWRFMSISSLATAIFLASQHPHRSKWDFLATFTATWSLLFLAWAVWAVFLWPKLFSPLRGLPGPEGGHWLMGQYHTIRSQPSGRPQTEWVNNIRHDGLIRYLFLFNQERVLVTSPKALAEVLVTRNYDFVKPAAVRWSVSTILGVGLLLAEGDEHKLQRKKLMPAFAFRHVKDLYPVFWSKSVDGVRAMTEQILTDSNKTDDDPTSTTTPPTAMSVLEIGAWASRITLDIIGVAGLGHDFGAIRDPDNPLVVTYQRVFKPSRQGQLLGLLGLFLPGRLVQMLPVKRNEDVVQASRVIRSTCRDLIREKKEKLAQKQLPDMDILSVALESGTFTDENLVDQMMTFLAAGHETTASAMTWAVYMLCLHPDVQSRLRAEIRAHLPSPDHHPGSDSATVTAIDIDRRLPYLSAVCSEVLRYFAPVPMTLREAAVDTSLNGQKIPKGTRIMLCPWAVNKDVSLWGDDAGVFNPDRWLASSGPSAAGENSEGDGGGEKATTSGGASSNYAFMTFLHGPRSCIGQGFAKAEFACILASWIGRFEFSLKNEEEYDENKVDIKYGITARPAKGLYVNATVVEGW